ncbi:MAG: DUF420 domain-containing protein [Bacteroidetes bacterium]|nr:DUF420 domain-containing protein [Bacteroidota bacterium]
MKKEQVYFLLIILVSILIPTVVAYLILGPQNVFKFDVDVSFLPTFHAILNSSTAVLLITGYILIRNRIIRLHRICMITASVLSLTFLISYVIYHSVEGATEFGGEGTIRSVYFFILISHIILAVVILPLVLTTLYRGLTGNFPKHKKIARWTLPIWLYVAITGVIVYMMIRPYY